MISAIVHVGRDLDEPWPIVIVDNNGIPQEVDIPPGKIMFYESARLMHWRRGEHHPPAGSVHSGFRCDSGALPGDMCACVAELTQGFGGGWVGFVVCVWCR